MIRYENHLSAVYKMPLFSRIARWLSKKLGVSQKLEFLRELAAKYGYEIDAKLRYLLLLESPLATPTEGERKILCNPLSLRKLSFEDIEGEFLHEHLHTIFKEKYPEIFKKVTVEYQDLFSELFFDVAIPTYITSAVLDYYDYKFLAKEVLTPEEYRKYFRGECKVAEDFLSYFCKTLTEEKEIDIGSIVVAVYASLLLEKSNEIKEFTSKYNPEAAKLIKKIENILSKINKPEDILTALEKIYEEIKESPLK